MAIGGPVSMDPDEYFSTDPGIPFHLLRRQKPSTPLGQGPGASGQLGLHGLDEMYVKFSDKNIKEGLNSFLPDLPGYIDAPGTPETSLQSLIDKPPVGGRELIPLSEAALQGFCLMPGSVPEQYKFMNKPPEKKKKKKHKHHESDLMSDTAVAESSQDRKHKKRIKKEENGGKEKKKKDKRKKKKSAN